MSPLAVRAADPAPPAEAPWPSHPTPAPPRPPAQGAPARGPRPGLPTALLAYVAMAVLVITLAPFEFRRPEVVRVWVGEWTVLDVVANVVLFAPLGFLFQQARRSARPDRRAPVLDALLLGAAASAVVETLQLLVPDRYTSPWDVLTNALGAALGAAAYDAVRRRLDPAGVVGRLGLDLPLVGLVYLLVPLGWLGALGSGASPVAPWLLLALGLFGASVLGALQQRHFGPAGAFSPAGVGLAAAAGFVVCAMPLLTARPLAVGGLALAVGLFARHRAAAPAVAWPAVDRRFERTTLLRAAPFLLAYLLLVPLAAPEAAVELRRPYILHVLGGAAAFTLLGYATAEAWGRRELAFGVAARQVALVALPAAVAASLLRAAGVPGPAELPAILASAGAAVYGGWLYHLQRARIRALARQARRPALVRP